MVIKKVTEKISRQASIGSFVKNINPYLAFVFLVIWISIGLFLLLVIAGSVKQGAFDSILGKPAPSPVDVPAQTEAQLPGIGKVNIECTQNAISTEAIGKVLDKGNTSDLTEEEKTKLEVCIVEREATPAPTPAS